MRSTYLGVDVGGTKTEAILCRLDGNQIAFGIGPGGNHENVGEEGLVSAMRIAINDALTNFHSQLPDKDPQSVQIEAAGFGISGFDWESDRALVERAIRTLQLGCEFVVENDVVPALWAGTTEGWGIAVTAGTGNNVRGRNSSGKTGRISGNSIRNGEFGGAAEMMFLARQRISQIWTLREESSILVERFLEITGAPTLEDLVEGLVRNRYLLTPQDAPIILDSAQAGDALAIEIVWFNINELSRSVQAVARQLGLQSTPFELVLCGSLFTKSAYYRESFMEIMRHNQPNAKMVLLDIPIAAGALMMARMESISQTPEPGNSYLQAFTEIQAEIKTYFPKR